MNTQTIVVITAKINEKRIFFQMKPLTMDQLSLTVPPLAGINDLIMINSKGISTKSSVMIAKGNKSNKFRFILEVTLNRLPLIHVLDGELIWAPLHYI
jgi:hypothetical protein